MMGLFGAEVVFELAVRFPTRRARPRGGAPDWRAVPVQTANRNQLILPAFAEAASRGQVAVVAG